MATSTFQAKNGGEERDKITIIKLGRENFYHSIPSEEEKTFKRVLKRGGRKIEERGELETCKDKLWQSFINSTFPLANF